MRLQEQGLKGDLLNQDQVVSRTTIFSKVWGYHFDPGTKIIDVQICYLRKILLTLQAPFEIKTFRGKGLSLQMVEHKVLPINEKPQLCSLLHTATTAFENSSKLLNRPLPPRSK